MTAKGFISGKGLLKRILLTLALACGVLLFLAALDAEATPIRPDIRKLVSEPQPDATAQFMPARAGWDGPEMSAGQSPVVSSLATGAGLARVEREELLAAATPDPRAILGIAAVIFLLRLLRRQEKKHASSTPVSLVSVPAGSVPASPLEDDHRIAA